MVHNVNTLNVWFAHPKYCQITLKPLGFCICQINKAMAHPNIGILIAKRLEMERCSIPIASATIRRALRKAVSPLVIGAATTPSMARMAPATPSQSLHTRLTTAGADVWNPAVALAISS